jgi:CubicO group peptidase (beta-lactamase class C family)
MRKRNLALIAITLAALGGGVWFASLDRETRGLIANMLRNADVFTWSVPQRDAAFRAMDRLPRVQSGEIAASSMPLPLPQGKPLNIPGIDAFLASQRVAGIVILQDGKVRFESYGLGFDAKGRWTSFSLAKSFTSTLVGAAIQDGYIKSLEDKVSGYIPDLKGSAYDDVTVRQLLTMTSGVRWSEDYEDPKSEVVQFSTATPEPGVDATVSFMRKLPRAHPPGSVFTYNTGETNLIGVLVSSATGKPLSKYVHDRIWQPAGMEAKATWLKGTTGHEIAGCCIQATVRDFARMGLFVLADGTRDGVQVVPKGWFAEAITKQQDIGLPGRGYGFQWWTYDDGSVAAKGIFGQGIYIDPKRRLVIASNGNWARADAGPEGDERDAFYKQVQALLDAEAAG